MQAIIVKTFGGEENLKLETNVPIPAPGKNEVLIKVMSVGVNPVDTYIRSGTFSSLPSLPYTPGDDVAGIVEDVGAEVTSFKKGDRVYTVRTTTGAYAQYAIAQVQFVNHLPDKLSYAQGAAIGIPYYTASKALHLRSGFKPGETVLIHGASGAVGIAAIQISKKLGLRVVGTAGTKDGMDLVKKTGADFVFNHRDQGYVNAIKDALGGGVDIILEMLANVNLQTDLELLNVRGRVLVIGCRGNVEINPRTTMGRESSIIGILLLISTNAEFEEMHGLLGKGLQEGWLVPEVYKTYPLADAATAHHDIINNTKTMGKLVLDTAN
ncbi:quinone oxidoreductase [Elysia marginata]|uniref:Quinone oxidoreductase n=1 Tax=Elysia marginata TaxID=1093978 RepID=A0AAV4JVF6_9GAST|nr:quinone oxidoreductase [Elysia marginata]